METLEGIENVGGFEAIVKVWELKEVVFCFSAKAQSFLTLKCVSERGKGERVRERERGNKQRR